ncbi:uncharacterized protein B0H64DRAFT_478303 [Chaetomium fimeti]|uniref:Aminoglycoside phosphotransferase domain-containing protein n=1 Tax=Chaetomium fimeti TaxID=1854472 RepID=A0AAE0H7R8_9PEZI|nr:hypothetical protein B0H64DRAFT_478303 [Chaetomium fimeti]
MEVPYNLDSAIEAFFHANTTATRQQCDNFARVHGGSPVKPVQLQGMFSYTVLVGTDKIFQFRFSNSQIDIELLSLAATIHGAIIPACTYHGIIGESQPLCIYEMNNLAGVPYIMAQDTSIPQPPETVRLKEQTVRDFAKFFAQGWNNPQRRNPDTLTALSTEFGSAFDRLAESLPPRFTPVLAKVKQDLPSLFARGDLPLVLTHGDLCEMNILVDRLSGKLTGVIDWAEARVLPFGFALYGLENLLGYMDSKGWHYYDNAQQLRRLFWGGFRKETGDMISDAAFRTIETARMAGLFYRYGLVHDGTAVLGVVGPQSSSLKYLDAFCNLDGWVQAD